MGGTLSKQERAGDGSCGTKIPEPARPVRGKTLRLVSCHLQVQVPVLPGGIFPGYVLVHVLLDHFVPAVAVGEVEGLGPVDGVQQEAWAFARAVLSVEYNMW